MLCSSQFRFIALISLILMMIASSSAGLTRKASRLAAGSWGGQHIAIQVEADSATIEYDCGNGTITGPLTIDSRGHFNWRGTFTPEGHGPIRLERAPKSQAVVYSGTVKGDTMTLKVKLADTNQVSQSYTLIRGNRGRVVKCK